MQSSCFNDDENEIKVLVHILVSPLNTNKTVTSFSRNFQKFRFGTLILTPRFAFWTPSQNCFFFKYVTRKRVLVTFAVAYGTPWESWEL